MRALEGTGGAAGGHVAAITLDAGVDALIHDFRIEFGVESGRAAVRGSRDVGVGPATGQHQGGDDENGDPWHVQRHQTPHPCCFRETSAG